MPFVRNKESIVKRILKKTVILFLIFGVPCLIFLFTFSLKRITVEGSIHYSDKQIKGMLLNSKEDYNSVIFYLKYNYISKPEIPFVEKMDIEMKNSHTLSIQVYEKQIAGCVKFMGEYLYFDKDGIVVESSPTRLKNIPVIEGLLFDEITLHKKLKVQKDATSYLKIMDLTNLINKYKIEVDAIIFDKNNQTSLLCGEVQVLMGKRDYYDVVLSDLKSILTKANGTGLYELDMRKYEKGSKYIIGKSKSSTE